MSTIAIGSRRELLMETSTRGGTVFTDVLFMASRDGTRFYVWPEAFVRPGIQRPGSWYYGGAWCAWGMVETASAQKDADLYSFVFASEKERAK